MVTAVQARRAQIAEKFGPGARYAAVAAAFGISYATARNDMVALGWAVGRSGVQKGDRNKGSTERYDAILRAVQAAPHRSLRSFGDQFGITAERVRQIIALAGFEKKPSAHQEKRRMRLERKRADKLAKEADRVAACARALALYQRGMTFRQVGAEIGVSTMTAYRRVCAALDLGVTVPAE